MIGSASHDKAAWQDCWAGLLDFLLGWAGFGRGAGLLDLGMGYMARWQVQIFLDSQ